MALKSKELLQQLLWLELLYQRLFLEELALVLFLEFNSLATMVFAGYTHNMYKIELYKSKVKNSETSSAFI